MRSRSWRATSTGPDRDRKDLFVSELKRPDIKQLRAEMDREARMCGHETPKTEIVRKLCDYIDAVEAGVCWFADERIKTYCGETREGDLSPECYLFDDASPVVRLALKVRKAARG